MKKYLVALSLLFLSMTANAESADLSYWTCDQLGIMNNAAFWISSGVYKSKNKVSTYEKEQKFQQTILENTENTFSPALEAQCKGFSKEEAAEKYLKDRLDVVYKRKIHILWINFSY